MLRMLLILAWELWRMPPAPRLEAVPALPHIPITPATIPGLQRVTLAAARQYALEMSGTRVERPGKPLVIGGVRLKYAAVHTLPATELNGVRMSLEIRVLDVVYLDNWCEAFEFDAAGRLMYRVEPYLP